MIQAHGLILSLILFFIGYSPCSLWCDPPLLHRAYWYVWVLFSTDLCWLSLSSSISLHDNEFPVRPNSSFVEWSELRLEDSDEAKLKLVVWSVVVRVIGLFLCSWLADWRNVDGSPLHRMFFCPVIWGSQVILYRQPCIMLSSLRYMCPIMIPSTICRVLMVLLYKRWVNFLPSQAPQLMIH